MRTRRFGLLAVGLGLLAATTGCSGGSDDDFTHRSAGDIVDSARADMGDLDTVHITGSLTSDGQDVDVDVHLSTAGDCTGTLGLGGGTTELLGVGGATWIKPDEAFWRASAGDSADQVMAVVGDKWVVLPKAEASFDEFCDLDELLGRLLTDDRSDPATYATQGTDQLDGDPVVLVDSTDEEGTSTGYVRTDAPHYLVKLEKTGGTDSGSVTFTDFDVDVDAVAPAPADVVDLDSLG